MEQFMELAKQQIDRILELQYQEFDLLRNANFGGVTVETMAKMHIENTKRMMIVVQVEGPMTYCEEYVPFFIEQSLTPERLEQIVELCKKMEAMTVEPDKHHTMTLFSPFIVTQNIDKPAQKAIKRVKFLKQYNRGNFGWSSIKILALDMSDKRIYANGEGKEIGKLIERKLKA